MDFKETLSLIPLSSSDTNAKTRKWEIKRIIEALLFSAVDPLSLEKIKEIIHSTYPLSLKELQSYIEELKEEYKERAFQIAEVGGGLILRTVKEMHPYLELLHLNRRGEKLSKAAAEVLAIVAYKEVITRAEIDKIRGVDSSGTLHCLLERDLVEIVGRLEGPGRPSQYGITKRFLRHFGLKSKEDLKPLLQP